MTIVFTLVMVQTCEFAARDSAWYGGRRRKLRGRRKLRRGGRTEKR